MAKKKYILSESAVRRFQKLALVRPINELGMSPAYNRDEEMYEQDDDEDVDVGPMGDVDVDVEEPVMDEPLMEPEAGEASEEMARTVIQAVADALGVDIDIEGGEELPGEDVEDVEELPGEDVEELEEVEEVEEVFGGVAGAGSSASRSRERAAQMRKRRQRERTPEEEALQEIVQRVLGHLKETTNPKSYGPGKETKPGANVVPAGSRYLKEEDLDEEAESLDEVDVIDEEDLTEAVMKRVVERLKGMAAKSKKA